MKYRLLKIVVAALGLITLSAAGAVAAPAPDPLAGETVVAVWNEATLEAIREASMPAPIAARALAIVNTAMYDAWAAYDPVAQGTDGTSALKAGVHARDASRIRRAIAIAAFYALRDVSTIPMADTTLSQTGVALGRSDEAERIGSAAAHAVLTIRHHDGSNQLGEYRSGIYTDYTAYRPINTPTIVRDPNRWQPLLVYDENGSFHTQHFLVPQWDKVQTFAVTPDALMDMPSPARYGEAAYREQADALIALSAGLTREQKAIAEYWADGMMTDSPPGHWLRFGIWISKRDRHSVAQDAQMFFALSNALLDAGIACWHVKRMYDSERPITAIRTLYAGRRIYAWAGANKGPGWIDGADWQPYQPPNVVTPAFPEFMSGHSTFSAAAAEVLRRFTGSDRFGAAWTQAPRASIVERGEPHQAVRLRWATFSAAADQAGMSRRYGGIHFAAADLAGRRCGRLVGAAVYERAAAFIAGRVKR